MFIDLRVSGDLGTIDADVCIVGAGPAGIAIASEFLGTATRICLIESGSLEADANNQDLADGEMASHPHQKLRTSRDRRFGGSTNSWAGACAPMSRWEFERRAHIDLDGWPFSARELDPYYQRAQAPLQLGPCRYRPEDWADDDLRFLDFQPGTLATSIWQLSPRTNLGERAKPSFEASSNITVLLNATVTEILTGDQGRAVECVEARTLDGRSAMIKAKLFILACGAIDNARLLLLSRHRAPAGLGNGHDLVGRYFMQHPHVSAASFRATGSKAWMTAYKDVRRETHWLRARIGLSEEAQREHAVLSAVASLVDRFITDSLTHTQSVGYVSLKRILLDLRRGRLPVNLATELRRIATDANGIVIGALRHLRDQNGALYIMGEQFPNPESRVTLSRDKDRLGLPKARVDWRLLPIDKRSILVLVHQIRAEFRRLGLGEVTPDDWLTLDDHTWPQSLAGGHHHMGTTRMSEDPKKGVVDADARVHGVENLHIAGSSIFPTVGCANPTLTLTATSLRLADHLKSRMAKLETPSLVA